MGMGGYILCEWDSVQKEYPKFREAFMNLETEVIMKCANDWFPGRDPASVCGYLTPKSGEQFGRTTILPALFQDNTGTQMATWRQYFSSTGHQRIIAGAKTGYTIPEDFKVAWIGLAFPNKQLQISEIKFQIGDRKYGRIDLEELRRYNKPAVIFEKGFIIDEEQSFELFGYVEEADYQRIVMLGACYYRVIDKVLGNPGSAI